MKHKLLILGAAASLAACAPKTTVEWREGAVDPETGKALQTIVIQNPPKSEGWSLWLTQFKNNAVVDPSSNGDIEYLTGSLYRVVPKGEYSDSIVINYTAAPLKRQSWAPEGFVLEVPGKKAEKLEVTYKFQPAEAVPGFTYNKVETKAWDMIPRLKSVSLQDEGTTAIGEKVAAEIVSGQKPGWYRITLDGNVKVEAADKDGEFYANVTLQNMAEVSPTVPNMVIEDWPDLEYRGYMLDVSRNFTKKDDLLRFIDILSRYKVNYLHLHIGDDEGWRLEIDGLPELTSFGARRAIPEIDADGKFVEKDGLIISYSFDPDPDNLDAPANGYYSKSDFVEILKYAAERRIKVIPEFDAPGHSRAAIKSMRYRYETTGDATYLLDDEADSSKYTSAQHYSDNALCVAYESTYTFMEKVFDEVAKLYAEAGVPFTEIHIGGDEVPKGAWVGSPACQKLMAEKGWTDVEMVKDYFVSRMLDIAAKKGVKLDGWQELPQRLSDETFAKALEGFGSVNIWSTIPNKQRKDELPYKLANLGMDVILSNVTNTYADLAYNYSKLEIGHSWGGYLDERRAFSLLPFDLYKSVRFDDYGKPCDLTVTGTVNPKFTDGAKVEKETLRNPEHIRGVQAQLWTETIRSFDNVTYFSFPKVLGVFERGWNASPAWSGSTKAEDPEFLADFDRFYSIVIDHEMPYYDANSIVVHKW
ncbi:MAG: beta-N-acetylhexosaminidase [Bacteroidales bacterium]|nr:beta-N-acetylhexosaminidase [Bacteroidales bacterium]